ncbi:MULTISPECIES: GntR family transcriptional regulator [Streptomyces]|uniref:GntR family transcriptional regulator n=1 Tax=Streptomyces TaxID=1883 RepID=UPI000FDB343E|nr:MULTISPECIES: GntR family transcriptional regulator [unclassified Streptomyces]MBQ0965484.1 GntR family transcriptional regulator [Streptomyces sp. RK74B]MBQ1005352.1 GntR family transcriptional regulator [Streptomyces sp. RK23]MCW1096913.1 GntR family transcriptional regulator [Streptomyces sp. RS2]BET47161.1 GntR family transcriptional regulator [Kitasatospora aureofaciens]
MRIPAHSVCTAIRDDIVAGVHGRGSRLTEELLARRYGVSRVPVREALRTLEAEGFVVTRRHAGACVAEPTEQEAADLLETRTLLEPLGASRAAGRRTEAHLKVLRGLVRLGQERARQGTGEELRSLGGWFHDTLARAADSPSLTALLTQLRHKIAWMYVVEVPVGPVEYWAEHGAITDAVARGDGARARALMTLHIERSAAAHRLRFASGDGRSERVRNAQHPVNTAGPRR